MVTDRLYYTNSYLERFDATVADVRSPQGRTALVLDRSAFYPASGGQPHDTGLMRWEGGAAQVDEVSVDDGEVLHLVGEGQFLPLPGTALQASIDWHRRFDHMQQHSGQHLLSQVFERLYAMETVSVHIGPEENTVDLSTPTLDAAQMEAAEALVNEKVFAALEIRAYFVAPDELARVPLRRPPKVSGEVRIVEIDGYDFSACGGTHCRSTAEIGTVKLLRQERRKGIVRVTFLCGGRALRDYQRKHALIGATAALYSTDITQAPVLAERNLAQLKEAQRRIEELTGRLLAHEARQMLAAAEDSAGVRMISALREDLDAGGLRTLAAAIVAESGVIGLLGSINGGKLLLAFARSADVDAHMGNLLKATLQQAGGNGGGRPDFAQGGGVDAAHAPALLEFARAHWRD